MLSITDEEDVLELLKIESLKNEISKKTKGKYLFDNFAKKEWDNSKKNLDDNNTNAIVCYVDGSVNRCWCITTNKLFEKSALYKASIGKKKVELSKSLVLVTEEGTYFDFDGSFKIAFDKKYVDLCSFVLGKNILFYYSYDFPLIVQNDEFTIVIGATEILRKERVKPMPYEEYYKTIPKKNISKMF